MQRGGKLDKKHLTLIETGEMKKEKRRKKELIVTKEVIKNIETTTLTLKTFHATETFASFDFTYFADGEQWNIGFELELIVDTLIVDIVGEGMVEAIRIKASEVLEKIVECLRFKYKDKHWSLSHYYIADIEAYEERSRVDYPERYRNEWKTIVNQSRLETMDEMDEFLFQVEDIHDLELKIIGNDGIVLCEYLQKMKHITYQQNEGTECVIHLLKNHLNNPLKNINQKIVFAREVAAYGYNIWVDYIK